MWISTHGQHPVVARPAGSDQVVGDHVELLRVVAALGLDRHEGPGRVRTPDLGSEGLEIAGVAPRSGPDLQNPGAGPGLERQPLQPLPPAGVGN
jgi:hypothetical protein